jgi:VRR-NUC domain
MNQLESEIEAAVSEWCDERNILHAKFSPMGQAGWPDHIYFLPNGRPLLVEFKRPGEQPRKLQRYKLGLLEELGYAVFVAETKAEATGWIEKQVRAILCTDGAVN